jgi:hypothetical protein
MERGNPALANRVGTRIRIPRKKAVLSLAAHDAYPVSLFGPQHGLTPDQAWVAQRLLNRAVSRHGRMPEWRVALVMAGIISAIRNGRVGNSSWGRSMLAARGGQALVAQQGDHLRRIALLGGQTSRKRYVP